MSVAGYAGAATPTRTGAIIPRPRILRSQSKTGVASKQSCVITDTSKFCASAMATFRASASIITSGCADGCPSGCPENATDRMPREETISVFKIESESGNGPAGFGWSPATSRMLLTPASVVSAPSRLSRARWSGMLRAATCGTGTNPCRERASDVITTRR